MDLALLKRRRGVEKAGLTKSLTWIAGLDKDTVTTVYLKNKRDIVQGNYTNFQDVQEKIEEQCNDNAELLVQIAERDDYEAKFLDLISQIDDIILEKTPQQQPVPPAAACHHPPPPARSNVKLPALDLPTFHGTYEEWISFHDLFSASIDSNASLSKAQKLQYLKTACKGDAALLIRTLTVTDANYDEAWKILNERYDNTREIVSSLIKRLFSQQKLAKESSSHLQKLLDTTKEVLRTLTVLGRPVEFWDDIIVYFLVERMDPETRRQWAVKLQGTDLPNLKDLFIFLEQHIRGLEASQVSHPKNANINHHTRHLSSHTSSFDSNSHCPICKAEHLIFKCRAFTNETVTGKRDLVKKHSLCFNCLRSGHRLRDCRSQSTCRTCKAKHHTLLHMDRSTTNSTAVNSESSSHGNAAAMSDQRQVGSLHGRYSGEQRTHVLLATALAYVQDQQGATQTVRLLLDTGSEATLISESCVNSLGLRRRQSEVVVTGISSSSAGTTRGEVDLELQSTFANESIFISALVLPKVTGKIPNELCSAKSWPHVQGLQLADPDFHQPGNIDILLGAEYVPLIMKEGRKLGAPQTPIAEKTIFGWVLSGRVQIQQQTVVRTHHTQCNVDSILMKFWETEEISNIQQQTQEKRRAEEHFSNTYTRLEDGRFQVSLPFNQTIAKLGSSREIAIRRWNQVERRLSSKPELQAKYIKFMNDYERLNHMEQIDSSECGETIGQTNYLPHHFVMKTANTETKFRVVFDGSAKTTTNISINDCLLVGPTIQDDIFTLLLRFRTHQIVIKADVEKMYRQFRVDQQSSNFQRIVWRPTPADPIREYRLLTVTYGTATAPFLATRCLNQAGKDNEKQYPEASKVIQDDAYVDDIISGASDEKKAISLCADLQKVAASAQLLLSKWSSNSEAVLKSIPAELRESELPLTFDSSNSVKALGVQWKPKTDTFTFSVTNMMCSGKITKRVLLSEIAKVFDPLGFLSPVIIRSKILLQDLWKAALSWDDEIPDDILFVWKQYCEELQDIRFISIPRCITISTTVKQELHGFSDASIKAFGAVVYLRSEAADGTYHVKMVTAKTKVAPIKQESLPRLELKGAVMVAELLTTVKAATKLDAELYAWTDSTIVLKWISSFPSRWQTFVGNRVSKIQQLIPPENWKHVAGSENPADCASRGITPHELKKHPLWWGGPEWLSKPQLPTFHVEPLNENINIEEKKKPVLVHLCKNEKAKTFLLSWFNSFRNLQKMKRHTAIICRFARNYLFAKSKQIGCVNYGKLTPAELQSSLMYWVRFAQSNEFKDEKEQLMSTGEISKSSRLSKIAPFVDGEGVMRVIGRLQNSKLPDSNKHQIILPKGHLTTLIVEHYHLHHMHAGFQLLWANLQQEFWILRARDTIRHIIRSCLLCRRRRAVSAKQLMGNLPEARITPSRPFQNVGVDYAGPFNLKVMKGRSNKLMKSWIAIFVCMATKAIHLEPVSELSTEAFLSTLECFVSRRGLCQNIYSDCGTNFVGADKELKTLFSSSQHNTKIANNVANQGILWHFNPPATPHQGGLWEAAVKSTKYHLKRVIGSESLTFEQFRTVLCKVEACLNSRPLTPMSPSPDDMSVLTPGHFLIGQPLLALPQHDVSEVKINRLSRWQRAQQITQHFWKRWMNEYVSTLQKRFKWTTSDRDLQVGDIVLVKEDNTPPLKWKAGRVITTHPGQDKKVRVVTVRLYSTDSNKYYELKRHVNKLCPLLNNDEY